MTSLLPNIMHSHHVNPIERVSTPFASAPAPAAQDLESDGAATPVPSVSEDRTMEKEMIVPEPQGWRRAIKSMGPVWFSIPMGTGVASLVLTAIPWQGAWLYWIAVAIFCLSALTFAVVAIATIMRYCMFPECWKAVIHDPASTPFLGTIPIAFAVLIECWIFICVPYWGYWAVMLAWICWMVAALMSISVTIGVSYLLVSQPYIQDLTRFLAVQILPISATVVTSGTAAECANIIRNPDHAVGTMIAGYVMWSLAMSLGMVLLTVYYHRLIIHKYPPPHVIVSSFVPLGPLGMGGFTIMLLGKAARSVLPKVVLLQNLPIAGDFLYLIGIFTALVMWSFGMFWLCLAIAGLARAMPFPFNMSWWGATFPIGVFALSTLTLGVELPSMFFKVFGTIITICDVILWLVVFYNTMRGVWSGRLFRPA